MTLENMFWSPLSQLIKRVKILGVLIQNLKYYKIMGPISLVNVYCLN